MVLRRVRDFMPVHATSAGLTQQLLAFSRKQVLQPRVLDINGLIAGMKAMRRRLVATHVDLVVSLDSDVGAISDIHVRPRGGSRQRS
jgi:hypothetical protein